MFFAMRELVGHTQVPRLIPLPFIIPLHRLFQTTHQFIGRRAARHIPDKSLIVIIKGLLVVVRELRAIHRPHFVDAAAIIRLQKLAGLLVVHPIAIVRILMQPLCLKVFRAHAQVLRNAQDVFSVKGRRHCLAAVGAGGAINVRPDLGVCFGHQLRHILRHSLIQFLKKGDQSVFVARRAPAKILKIHTIHVKVTFWLKEAVPAIRYNFWLPIMLLDHKPLHLRSSVFLYAL